MKDGLNIDRYGNKYWYKNDFLHNENGPALERSNGTKIWYINGKCHRLDGPAEECPNGEKYWWYESEEIDCTSQEEFEHLIKLKVLW